MIVIRGIKEEEYARKIESNIVDCRDVLSALLHPPVTGYGYSDYFEKNLVKALLCFAEERQDLHNPKFLYYLLTDYYIPHIYLTYFHVLNEKSLEWLDNFDEDYHFIALNIKLDEVTKTAIGREYIGARMSYVNSIKQLDQDNITNLYSAILCSIEDLFFDKANMHMTINVLNTLAFPIFCREVDDKFTDIENEFRIIAYDCPRECNGELKQIPRDASIIGKSSNTYSGILDAGHDTAFKSRLRVLKDIEKPLSKVIEDEQSEVTINSVFKSIDISEITSGRLYIGDKSDCRRYIVRMLKDKQPEKYVKRTVIRTYELDGSQDMTFLPGHWNLRY